MSAHALTIDSPTDLLVEDRGGVRILAMGRGKANAISTEFAAAIQEAALKAQEDPGRPRRRPDVPLAEDLLRRVRPEAQARASAEEFARFARVFDALFFDLFLLGKPLVAALTGHAVAGGALLAATADFRFAAEGPGTIGLPGVRLGIHLPRHCMEAIRSTVGEQTLTRWALRGDTMSFREAREFGAIDRIVPPDRLLEEAVTFVEELGGASSEVYTAIKRDLRGAAYERAKNVLPEGRKAFVDSWFSETGQRGLASVLARRS